MCPVLAVAICNIPTFELKVRPSPNDEMSMSSVQYLGTALTTSAAEVSPAIQRRCSTLPSMYTAAMHQDNMPLH